MKKSVVLKYVFILICALYGWKLQAQEVKLTLNVQAWNLLYLLGNQKDVVTDLTLIGQINAYDIRTLRDMAKLTKLNLANVGMVPGSEFYVNNKAITVETDKIPDYMFFNMGNLTSVVLPNSVIAIGDQVFQECTGLTSVTIGNNVDSIGFFSFANCSRLTSITLPTSLVSIGNQAFWGCSGLISVYIPANVTSIGVGAFSICNALKEINVADGNTVYSSVDGVLLSKNRTILITYPNSKSANYTIPTSVSLINAYAFDACIGLGSVIIGDNVTTIDEGAFYDCTGLTTVSIGKSVKSLGKYIFYNCNKLQSVVIPDNVTSIGWYTFGHCRGLKSLTMGNGIISIDIYAFAYCTGLTAITVPSSVKSIGEWAFSDCTGLTEFHSRAATPPSAASSSFDGISKAICKLYVPRGLTPSYRGATGWSTFTYIVEEYGTSLTNTDYANVKVYANGNNIIVENIESGENIWIYNTLGVLLKKVISDNVIEKIEFPANCIYLVKVRNKIFKIALNN